MTEPALEDFVFYNNVWTDRYGDGTTVDPGTGPTPVDPDPDPGPITPNIFTVVREDLPFNVAPEATLASSPWHASLHKFTTFRPAFTSNQGSPTSPDVDTRWTENGSLYGVPLDPTNNMWARFNPPSYSTYATFGGLVRYRPLYERAKRPPVESKTRPGKMLDYRIQDQMDLVRQTLTGGINGYAVDVIHAPQTAAEYDLSLISPSNMTYWRATVETCEAIEEINLQAGRQRFYFLPMWDGSTSGSRDPASIQVEAIHYLLTRFPTIKYLRNGKLLVNMYAPNRAPRNTNPGSTVTTARAYTQAVVDGLTAKGYQVAFIGTPSQDFYASTTFPAVRPPAVGGGPWGPRDPEHTAGENIYNRRFVSHFKATYGQSMIAQMPVSAADVRPNPANNNGVNGIYDESNHFRQLIESWKSAIADDDDPTHVKADLVQLPTADDYGEDACWLPTYNKGWCLLDVGYYFLLKYKTGYYPPIVRPTIYVSHRIQPTADSGVTVTYTGPQTVFMSKRSGGTPNQNTVGLLVFAPPGDWVVKLNVGGRVYTYEVTGEAGTGSMVERFAPLLPIGSGLISATMATKAAPDFPVQQITPRERFKVRTTLVSQDMAYRMRSSREALKPATGLA